jgi:hypothetical protein
MGGKRSYLLGDFLTLAGAYIEVDAPGWPEALRLPTSYYVTSSQLSGYLNKTTDLISKADAEAGIATVAQSWSSLRVRQNVIAYCDTLNLSPLTLEQESNQDESFVKPFEGNSKLEGIDYRWIDGTPNVKVGTTEGGEEILSAMDVPENGSLLNLVVFPFDTDMDVYITITGGTVDVKFIYRLNYWT